MNILVNLLDVENLNIPKQGTKMSAGYDIIAASEPKIVGEKGWEKDTYCRIDYIEYATNLFFQPCSILESYKIDAHNFHTLIHPRGSISKYALLLCNSVGLGDQDYYSEYKCRFKYIPDADDFVFDSDKDFCGWTINKDRIYKKGDAIAQLVFSETYAAQFKIVKELNKTDRVGGFGSTTK